MLSKLLLLLCFRLCVGQADEGRAEALPKPSLRAWPSSVVPAGSSVTLRCGTPTRDVSVALRKVGSVWEMVQSPNSTEGQAEFHLSDVKSSHAGEYTCKYHRRGNPHVSSGPSDALLLLVTGYLRKPSLQAHRSGAVTEGQEVTLQCQRPATELGPVMFALLKAGSAAPVQVRPSAGRETDFSLLSVSAGDSGNYSCVYYQARAPFRASQASPRLEIRVAASPPSIASDYTTGNHIRLALAAAIMVIAGAFLLEAWCTQRHVRGESGGIKCGNPRPLLAAQEHCWCLYLQCLLSAPRHSELLPMSFHGEALRTIGQAALKTTYLTQMGVGALGNAILLFHNIAPGLLAHSPRPPHTILTHMALANLLFLLSSGVLYTMAAFVSRNPLNSLGCKCAYYVQRVALSTALCSTCVLSTYQSFTLTPRRAEWVMLRGRAPRVTGPSCCTCWVFSLLMYIYVPVKITGPQDTHNYTDSQGKWFCSISGTVTGFGYLWFISDAMFITLMVCSSGSMVLLLHRHHQRVQYLHTLAGHHRCPPETRAAHTILMLMVTFVTFYLLNYSLVFHISASSDFRLWLLQVSHVLSSCFPTISPFLLLLRDPRTPRFCS